MELFKLRRIAGLKDVSGNLPRFLEIRSALGSDVALLSGDDALYLLVLARGGDGIISMTSNVAPKMCVAIHAAWQSGEVKKAQRINQILAPLNRALFLETSPAPVKYAASLLDLSTAEVRPPLCAIEDYTKVKVREAMAHAELLESELSRQRCA